MYEEATRKNATAHEHGPGHFDQIFEAIESKTEGTRHDLEEMRIAYLHEPINGELKRKYLDALTTFWDAGLGVVQRDCKGSEPVLWAFYARYVQGERNQSVSVNGESKLVGEYVGLDELVDLARHYIPVWEKIMPLLKRPIGWVEEEQSPRTGISNSTRGAGAIAAAGAVAAFATQSFETPVLQEPQPMVRQFEQTENGGPLVEEVDAKGAIPALRRLLPRIPEEFRNAIFEKQFGSSDIPSEVSWDEIADELARNMQLLNEQGSAIIPEKSTFSAESGLMLVDKGGRVIRRLLGSNGELIAGGWDGPRKP
jgi:hypothetical protein